MSFFSSQAWIFRYSFGNIPPVRVAPFQRAFGHAGEDAAVVV